jgi:hypothetical protein
LQGFFIAWGIAGYRAGLVYWSFGWMNAYILAAFSEVTSAIVSMLMASYPAAVGLYNGPFTCGVLPTSGILIATPTVPFAIRLVAYVNPIHYVVGSEIINQFHNRTVTEVRLLFGHPLARVTRSANTRLTTSHLLVTSWFVRQGRKPVLLRAALC